MSTPTQPDVKPHLTIRPPSGWAPLDLRELWQFRDLLTTFGGRDVKVRYKQTALGAIWVVLQPLLGAGIFTFVFGMLAGMESKGDYPYFVLAFAGMMGWTAFSATLSKTSASLTGNTALVSKVYFPRMILPLSTLFSTLVDLAVSLALMAALMIVFGINPGPRILLAPVWLALMLMLAMGVGMFCSSLMVSYRDVAYVLPVAVQFLLYASPVGYGLTVVLEEKIPPSLQTLYMLNPLATLIEGFRWSFLGTGNLYTPWIAYAAAVSIAAFLLGAFSFKRMERRFADVI